MKGGEEERLERGRKRIIFLQERNGGAEWNWDKALNWGGRKAEI